MSSGLGLRLGGGLGELLLDMVAENLGLLKSFVALGHGDVDVTLQGIRDGARASARGSGGVVVVVFVVFVVVHDSARVVGSIESWKTK